MTGPYRFQVPPRWVDDHLPSSWPLDLPHDTAGKEGLCVALLHVSGLYENRSLFPDTTPGVLLAMARLGERFLRSVVALRDWQLRPSDDAGQLSRRLAARINVVRSFVREESWLRPNVAFGRGESQSGVFSDAVAGAQYCQLLGWYLLDDQWTSARDLAEYVLRRTDEQSELVDDTWGLLQQRLPKGLRPEIEYEGDGPDHARVFRATLRVPGLATTSAIGRNKKDAKRLAAQASLEKNFPQAPQTRPPSPGSGCNSPALAASRLGLLHG
jgi:dsRNA-specific ribonuclease